MNWKMLTAGVTLLVCAILAWAWAGDIAEGQDLTPEQREQTRRSADLLFQDIMQTLPLDAKVQVDSAAKSSHDISRQPKRVDSVVPGPVAGSVPADNALKGLPDDLRRQVEKAIVEMEQRNEQRAIEFKEHRRGLQGTPR